MDPNLTVQLFVPRDGKEGNIGTAYPVARDVIITAAHVLEGGGHSIEARWWHLTDSHRKWLQCNVLWDGRTKQEQLDIALLGCKFPEPVAKRWGHLADVSPKAHTKWEGAGFPAVGMRGDSLEPTPLSGTVHTAGDRSVYFQLNVDAPALADEDWEGASGSPVFVGNLIIGVVANAPRRFKSRRFDAVPIYRLLQQAEYDDFRKHINYSRDNDQREQLVDYAIKTLVKSRDVMEYLAADVLSDDRELATSIVRELLQDNDVVVALTPILDAMDAFAGNPAATNVLDDLVYVIPPAALAGTHLSQIQLIAEGKDEQFRFEAKTKTFVEVAMARVGGRPTDFQKPENQRDNPEGVFCLQKPPEAGMDEDGEKFKRAFIREMGQHIVAAGLYDDDLDELTDAINDELELRHRRKEGLHYYVFELPENEHERANRLHVVRELDKTFPYLTFVALPKVRSTKEERQAVSLLLRYLCRAAGIEFK